MGLLQATGLRAGAGKGLPLLLVVLAAVGVAAWYWPVGERPFDALAPAPGARASLPEPGTSPAESLRSPLAAQAPDAAAVARAASRREANDAARAPLLDARERAKESEHYARFLALAAQDPRALEDEAALVLAGTGPDCEKVALLRALESSGSAQACAWLEHALARLPDRSSPAGDSVPGFALGMLLRADADDAQARAALERVAFGATRAPDRLRRVAAASFAASASESELWRLAANLAHEPDGLLRASVLEALSRHPSPSAVAAVFGQGHDVGRQESAGTAQE